jgi:RNA polymerase sigma-70 factor (ECF subfamily)
LLEQEFADVLRAAQAGAAWAWRRLHDDLAGHVLGYIRAQGAREPEDLLAEVLLQIARNIHSFEGAEKGFRSWVFQIAHNRVIDERRRLRRNPVDPTASVAELLPAQGDVTAGEVIDSIQAERIRALILKLVPAQRDVLLLRILSGLTVPEVAAVVGKSEGAVKALQRRGLVALSRHLESEGIPR